MNIQTRIEEDLLGFREVSEGAFYGIQKIRAAVNLRISGVKISSCPMFIRSILLVKKAVASTKSALGILSKDMATAII